MEPADLKEQLAMTEVRSSPERGKVLGDVTMTDPRWHVDDGWVKVQQTHGDVNIHFVRNERTGEVDDFKFKDD
jgi:hypothetical protein